MALPAMHAATRAGETTNETEPRRPSLSGGHRAPGWRLHVVASPDPRQVGHVYDLAVGSTAIGRTPSGSGAWLMFEDRATSRDHVVLVNLGHHAGVEVRDCQSRNGTYVDGVRRDQCRRRTTLAGRAFSQGLARPPARPRSADATAARKAARRRPDLVDLCDAVAPVSEASGAGRPGETRAGRPRRWRDLLAREAVETLLLYPWDENLRELRAVLVRVAATARHGDPIGPEQLPVPLKGAWEGRLKSDPHWQPGNWLPATPEPYLAPIGPGSPATPIAPPPAYHRPAQDVLHQLLVAHHGNVEAVASELGRNRHQVYRWMELAGIDRVALAKYRGR
jgi:hypothetical protein